MDADKFECVEVTSAEALWDWLGRERGRDEAIWLVTWKAARRDRYVSRDEVLDALIAHGWIDGRRMTLDEERTMQLVSPRRQQGWAKSYRDRAARLIGERRMQPPGQAAIDASKAAGLWEALPEVDALADPADLTAALAERGAQDWWAGAAPSYRRNVLRWIAGAKRPPTRAKRIEAVAAHAARGEKVPNY